MGISPSRPSPPPSPALPNLALLSESLPVLEGRMVPEALGLHYITVKAHHPRGKRMLFISLKYGENPREDTDGVVLEHVTFSGDFG